MNLQDAQRISLDEATDQLADGGTPELTPEGLDNAERIAEMLGVDPDDLSDWVISMLVFIAGEGITPGAVGQVMMSALHMGVILGRAQAADSLGDLIDLPTTAPGETA